MQPRCRSIVTRGSEAAPASVTFFFPYHEVSGVPMLFARMAACLAAAGTAVDVIDYADGYMARALSGVSGVRLRPFSDGAPIDVGRETTLVMQSILPATIRPELRPDRGTRLLFWTLHPMNLVQSVMPFDRIRHLQTRYAWFHGVFRRTVLRALTARLRALVEAMHARRAIAFMDGETLDLTANRLAVAIPDPLFLPVACPVPNANRCEGRSRSGPFGMAWLGRLSDFKIHILLRTLAQASAHAARTRQPIVFHVIGDGPEAGRIDIGRLTHADFTIVRAGVLVGETLDAYLVTHVDLLAAMGTSSLEGAKLGVPTILLDFSYGSVPASYRFAWLHESDRYILGRVIDQRMLEPGNDSLARLIEAARSAPAEWSARSYRYCRDHHALAVVGRRLGDVAAETSFRWSDIDPSLRRKGLIRSTYEHLRAWRRPAAGAAS